MTGQRRKTYFYEMIGSIKDLSSLIDHTILKPALSLTELESWLSTAIGYPFASVIVPPWYVNRTSSFLKDTHIRTGTVVGFPLGFQTRDTKIHEAIEAVSNGASEIDMVMNICAFKSKEYSFVSKEIEDVVEIVTGGNLKVIIETCYLNDKEKQIACDLAIESGATFIKTSTGFAHKGARVEDVRLLKRGSRGRIKVKASGGIRDLDTFILMIEAGADRIGTSSGVAIIEEYLKRRDEV